MKARPAKILVAGSILPAALLSLSLLPVLADAPSTGTASTTAPASASVSAPGTAAAALDALIGKPQIVGITEKNGTLFLGRVLSGDHTHYTFQAFHFAGPSQTTTQAYGSGRYRRSARIKTPTYIPDVRAVQLLLAGTAGSQTHPRETLSASGILAVSDIKCIQALSPPVKPAKKLNKAGSKLAAAASSASPPVAPVSSGTRSSTAATAPASPWAWTMTTLWPVAAKNKT